MMKLKPVPESNLGHHLASCWARLAHCLFFLILVVATTFRFPLTGPVSDGFFIGENAMYGVANGNVPSGRPPILAHGGVDVIPGQMAAAVCRGDTQIVCVRAINAVISAICSAAFLMVLVLITGLGTISAAVASLPAIATLIAYNGTARSAFNLQTGTPNPRELFVLLILAGLFWLYRADQRMTSYSRLALPVAIGFLVGVGLFWWYNRGLFAVVLVWGAVGGFSWYWRDWRPLVFAGAGGLAGLACAHLSGFYGDTMGNFESMYYWQMDNDIFRMPPETDFFAVTAPLIPLYVLLLSWASWVIWRDLRAGRIQSIFPTLTLVAILLFYGFQAHERMFASYAAHTLWGISLLSGLLSVRASRHGFGLVALTALSAAVGVLSVLLNIRRLPPNLGEWAGELAANARSLMSPLPRDSDLVDDGLRQAVAIVRARAPVCTYTFSNEGLLYVLANTPPCSRFAYPFYIAFDRQAEVISEFEQTKPPIVLWTSSSPQATIYGRDLVARTPTLVAWVTAHYPYRKMLNDGYELRMLEPLNDGTK